MMKRTARWLAFYAFLRPLIVVNHSFRRRGWLEDRWFWADAVATGWGYFVRIK